MILTILVLLFLLCFFIISIPLYLIEAIIGHFDIHKKERSSFVIVTTALKIIIWLSGIHLIVKGQEKVPKDQAVLYVSNHRSYFDIVTLYPLTNNTTGFVAKKELERIPFIRRWMRYMNCQFLDRENIKEGLKTILNCIATVKGGCSICIGPAVPATRACSPPRWRRPAFSSSASPAPSASALSCSAWGCSSRWPICCGCNETYRSRPGGFSAAGPVSFLIAQKKHPRRSGGAFFQSQYWLLRLRSKHSRQYTGRSPLGWKGTWVVQPQPSQITS